MTRDWDWVISGSSRSAANDTASPFINALRLLVFLRYVIIVTIIIIIISLLFSFLAKLQMHLCILFFGI